MCNFQGIFAIARRDASPRRVAAAANEAARRDLPGGRCAAGMGGCAGQSGGGCGTRGGPLVRIDLYPAAVRLARGGMGARVVVGSPHCGIGEEAHR